MTPQTRRRARASLSDLSAARDIESLSVRQLKEILARNFVNYSGCCEKWELLERVHRLYRENLQNRKSSKDPTQPVHPAISARIVEMGCIYIALLSKATYNKYICQKKEKQQYIAVGTVRMFMEVPSTNNH